MQAQSQARQPRQVYPRGDGLDRNEAIKLTGGGDPTTLGSEPTFTEEAYQRAKPVFTRAWAEAKVAGHSPKAFFKSAIAIAKTKATPEWMRNVLAPMMLRFVAEQRASEAGGAEPEPAPAAEPALPPAGQPDTALLALDPTKRTVPFAKAREVVPDTPVEARRMEARAAEERTELAPIRLSHRVGRLFMSRLMAVVWLLAVVLVALPVSYERLAIIYGPTIAKFTGELLYMQFTFFLVMTVVLVLLAVGTGCTTNPRPSHSVPAACSCSSPPQCPRPDSRITTLARALALA